MTVRSSDDRSRPPCRRPPGFDLAPLARGPWRLGGPTEPTRARSSRPGSAGRGRVRPPPSPRAVGRPGPARRCPAAALGGGGGGGAVGGALATVDTGARLVQPARARRHPAQKRGDPPLRPSWFPGVRMHRILDSAERDGAKTSLPSGSAGVATHTATIFRGPPSPDLARRRIL